MGNSIIEEIRRVGCVLVLGLIFIMTFLCIITNISIGKVQRQNQQIIELLQQNKLED